MKYLDFELEIGEFDGDACLVSVRSQVGEAERSVAFPFTDVQLERQLLRLENAILRSSGGRRRALTDEEDEIQVFGKTLFDFILNDETLSLYRECLREGEYRGQGVRLKLHIQSPQLAELPWEYLFDPRRNDYICLDPYTPLIRYLNLAGTISPLAVTPPLRILGMVVSPRDREALDVAEEKQRIERALGDMQRAGFVDLTWLEGQTWRDLQRAMRTGRGPWHVFHFIGHAALDARRDEGMLLFADAHGDADPVSATQLSRMLARQRRSLRLVLLNACESARVGQGDIFSSTAATLVRGGAPAVLAMQYEITDGAAVEFSRTFYEALADGLPVDTAVSDARNAINLGDEYSLEWGTPVLYMRAEDGQIFAIEEAGDELAAAEAPAREESAPTAQPLATHTEDPPAQIDPEPPAEIAPAPSIHFDWITIPAGEFLMGSDSQHDPNARDRELPQHRIGLPDYQIARTQVSNSQYKIFVDATDHRAPEHWQDGVIPAGKEDHPVIYVSWRDAIAFGDWTQTRLPTEAEWEKAARGVDGRIYPWGDALSQDRCNFNMGEGDTTPVDDYPDGASPYGLLNMSGNVLEWASTLYKKYPYNADDGREDQRAEGHRVLRGGSFFDRSQGVRSAVRDNLSLDARSGYIGFRVARLED